MARWLTGLLVAAAACAAVARAQELEVGLTQRRGLLVLDARGRVPAVGRTLTARLRRVDGGPGVVEVPVRHEGDLVELQLVSRAVLLPGAYLLELRAADEVLLARDLAVGAPQEATASRERQRVWLVGATRAVRDAAARLEVLGEYHAALARREPARADEAVAGFDAGIERWRDGLRQARMDLEAHRRRVLLPHLPGVAEDLRALVEGQEARAQALGRALRAVARGEAGADAPAVDVALVVRRMSEALGEPFDLPPWRAGALATPPPPLDVVEAGVRVDPLGFRVAVPPGLTPIAPGDPYERWAMKAPGVLVTVEVVPLPDARSAEDMTAALETRNWEGFLAYRRLSSTPTEGPGLRLEFQARTGDVGDEASRTARAVVVQRALFDLPQRRAFVLTIARTTRESSPALDAVEASFARTRP